MIAVEHGRVVVSLPPSQITWPGLGTLPSWLMLCDYCYRGEAIIVEAAKGKSGVASAAETLPARAVLPTGAGL